MKKDRQRIVEALSFSGSYDDDPSWLKYDRTDDTWIVRDGFFFAHGREAKQHADRVVTELKEAGVTAEAVTWGRVDKPFRGAANVRNSSHWWVRIRLKEEVA